MNPEELVAELKTRYNEVDPNLRVSCHSKNRVYGEVVVPLFGDREESAQGETKRAHRISLRSKNLATYTQFGPSSPIVIDVVEDGDQYKVTQLFYFGKSKGLYVVDHNPAAARNIFQSLINGEDKSLVLKDGETFPTIPVGRVVVKETLEDLAESDVFFNVRELVDLSKEYCDRRSRKSKSFVPNSDIPA